MIIGITGGTGCGKTTLLRMIQSLGGTVIDCDAVYHRLLKTDRELLAAISSHFPSAFKNGKLQRRALGELVFNDKASLNVLNSITHNRVKAEVMRLLQAKPKLAAIDAIGLFESGLDALCDVTVAVTAPTQQRVARLMQRDGITEEYARTRIDAQRSQEEFRSLCRYCLENDTTEEAFHQKCLAFFRELGIM